MNDTKQKLFVVEDDEKYILDVKLHLQNWPELDLHFFQTEDACLSYLSLNPDMVLIKESGNAKGMQGIEILQKIKRSRPDCAVIILLENDDPVTAELAFDLGAEACFLKGITSLFFIKQLLYNKNRIQPPQIKENFTLANPLPDNPVSQLDQLTQTILTQKELIKSLENQNADLQQKVNNFNSHLESRVLNRTEVIFKSLNRLENAKKELNTFIYRASHDLRGPIARLEGLVNLMNLENSHENIDEYLGHIATVVREMQQLNDKLIETHQLMKESVQVSKIEIEPWIQDVLDNVKFRFIEEDIPEISLDIEGESQFFTDPLLLEVIMENLTANAIIFRDLSQSTFPPIQIKIRVSRYRLVMSIYDEGIGIPKSELAEVTEMFRIASAQSKGSGLGLFLVKKAVEKLDGELDIKSVLGQNTQVRVYLPQLSKISTEDKVLKISEGINETEKQQN